MNLNSGHCRENQRYCIKFVDKERKVLPTEESQHLCPNRSVQEPEICWRLSLGTEQIILNCSIPFSMQWLTGEKSGTWIWGTQKPIPVIWSVTWRIGTCAPDWRPSLRAREPRNIVHPTPRLRRWTESEMFLVLLSFKSWPQLSSRHENCSRSVNFRWNKWSYCQRVCSLPWNAAWKMNMWRYEERQP